MAERKIEVERKDAVCPRCKGREWIPMREGDPPRSHWGKEGPEYCIVCPECFVFTQKEEKENG